MKARPLFVSHSAALITLHADLEGHALARGQVIVGTPGSIVERTNDAGFRFYAHQHYDGDGKKRETYVAGPIGDSAAETAAASLRERIRDQQGTLPSLRLLGREGFNLADAKTFATIGSLHKHGVFTAGGLLVGSHAFGIFSTGWAPERSPTRLWTSTSPGAKPSRSSESRPRIS